MLSASGAAERFDGDYLEKHLPASGVTLENRTLEMGTLVVAGPQSRELLQPLTDNDLSNAAFPWLSAQTIALGGHKNIHALRVNFVGELGWELHLPIDSLAPVFDAVVEAGKQLRHCPSGECGQWMYSALRNRIVCGHKT